MIREATRAMTMGTIRIITIMTAMAVVSVVSPIVVQPPREQVRMAAATVMTIPQIQMKMEIMLVTKAVVVTPTIKTMEVTMAVGVMELVATRLPLLMIILTKGKRFKVLGPRLSDLWKTRGTNSLSSLIGGCEVVPVFWMS